MNDFEILPSVEVLIFLGASPLIASCFRLGHHIEEESFEYSVRLPATKKSSMRKNHPKIKHQGAYYFIDPEVPTNSSDETDPSNNSVQPSLDEEESTSLLNLSNTRVLARRKRFAGVAPLAFLLIVGLLVGLVFVFLDDIVRKFSSSNSNTNEDPRTPTTSAPSTSAADIEETSSPVATLMPSPATTAGPSLPAIPSPTGTPSDSPTKGTNNISSFRTCHLHYKANTIRWFPLQRVLPCNLQQFIPSLSSLSMAAFPLLQHFCPPQSWLPPLLQC